MSHLGHALYVEHLAVGIAECLGIHRLGLRSDGLVKRIKVVDIQYGIPDALRRQCVRNQVIRTAIQVVGSHDVVSRFQYILQRIGGSRSPGGHSQRCDTSLKRSHARLKHILRRIGQSAVDVSGVTERKAVGCMPAVIKHIRCGLIDGHSPCAGDRVGLFLAYMKLQSLKVEIVVCIHKADKFYWFYDAKLQSHKIFCIFIPER